MIGRKRARQSHNPKRLDSLTFELLDRLPDWRQRAIEGVTITSALWSEREREIHVKPLRHVAALEHKLARRVGRCPLFSDDWATLVLPISDFPKVTQFDFSVAVSGEPVYRLSRRENCQLQVRYLRYLARNAGLCTFGFNRLEPLLVAIFAFRPGDLERELGRYRRPVRHYIRWCRKRLGFTNPVIEYLAAKYALPIDDPVFKDCQIESGKIRRLLDEETLLAHEASASQNPILALPEFLRENPSLTLDDALRLMKRLHWLLKWAHQCHVDDRAAKEFLDTYFSYGRWWPAFAWCSVPLDAPFSIEVREKREISFESPKVPYELAASWNDWRCLTARQYVSFFDAEVNHIHVRVLDDGVQLHRGGIRVKNDAYRDAAAPVDEHRSEEHYSRYDSQKSRDRRLWVECRLRQTPTRARMAYGLLAVSILAIWLLLGFGSWFYNDEARLNGADVAAILIPVTVAASLLLAPAGTTLGLRVKRRRHAALAIALFVLWLTVFCFYVMGRISIDTLHQDPP
ncbi:hypothetical protein [Streptomyces lydicus]|uniref:hypothetical protein n=1 Tax=Streptomyces lydicus TaxID=47763 RepID=UPI0036EE60B2